MSNKLAKNKGMWFENGELEIKAMSDPEGFGAEKITLDFVKEQIDKMDSFIDEIEKIKGIEIEKKYNNMAEQFYNANKDITNMQCIYEFSQMREELLYKG